MSADSRAGAPNLNLTPEEKRIFGQLFRQADNDNVGVITGDVAVKFFEKTKLDSRVLGEIWQVADQENRGFLTPAGFSIVLRLIGHAQAGREPSAELALQPGPIPRFDGIQLAGSARPAAPSPLQSQGTGAGDRVPALSPEKVSQYAGLFERQNLQNGNMLPGDQAKSIFEKSGLPNEVLGRIWQLADTEQRGALVLTEFVIAMHLLTSMKTGALRVLPPVLPAGLYEAAQRRGSMSRQSPTPTGIPRQVTGPSHMRMGSPLGRSPLGPQMTGLSQQPTGSDWAITPAEKARFDQLYADLDKSNKGFITGEEAVPFLSQSNLPEDTLASIWDLADINSEGRLTRDTFAVAMYLIRQQRSKRDGSNPLPTALPPNLIPPSMRSQARPQTAGASPFDIPAPAAAAAAPQLPPPPPKSALDDLFGLDAPAPALPQVAMSTGGSAAKDPFASASPIPPSSPVRASPTGGNTFKPFIPSSSFGRSLTVQDTGGSAGSGMPSRSAASASDDLLGDTDPEISKKLTNETAELANLSNQIGSLSTQMQQVQGQRASTQKEINQASQQKKNFEERLTQLRTAYEKEAKDVAALQDQLQKSRDETRKLMSEMATIDANYKDLRTQHEQLSTAYQADQQENASLKQRISAVNAEVAQLKPQIEKLKSDARQQKGLVAINKKQLSTVEGERDKLKTEADNLTKENEELTRQINSSSPSATTSAQVASPAPSSASANNPFFRRTGSTDIMGAFASPPPVKPYGEKSFEDIFGSFGANSSSNTPPPPTTFHQQNTGTSTASAGSNIATPATTSPTVSRQATLAAEPPAPPLSRQISSSVLPLGNVTESLTSSRQASPPLSRVNEDTATSSPLDTTKAPESSASDKSVGTPVETTKPPVVAAAEDKSAAPAGNGAIPGAFPTETPGEGTPLAGDRDSAIFENMKKDSNAEDDFKSAFASFGGAPLKSEEKSKDINSAFSNFNSEFPPISELERDDSSDSGDENHGFDDDFAPASPPAKQTDGKETPKAPTSPVSTTKTATSATASAAPDATKADETSSTAQPPSESAATPTPAVAPKTDDPFASDATTAAAPPPAAATAPTASKGAFDDLDDEFEGLEDAKEGSADDEFANISRSNLDDFNAVFDSSPPPSQPKSESTNVSNAFGHDSSYDFGTVSTQSTVGGAPTGTNANTNSTPTATGAPAPEPHDWNAIFAGLDDPPASEATPKPAEDTKDQGAKTQPAERPSAGARTLSEDGAHDDPILKNLTSMGYSRADALSALEKYDYNLERAANYLANQS